MQRKTVAVRQYSGKALPESEPRGQIEVCVEFVVAGPPLLPSLAGAVEIVLVAVRIVCWQLDLESSRLVECVDPFLVRGVGAGGEGVSDAARVTYYQPGQSG